MQSLEQTTYNEWFDRIMQSSESLEQKKKRLSINLKYERNVEKAFAFLDSGYADILLTEPTEKCEVYREVLRYNLEIIYGVQHNIEGAFKFLNREEVQRYFTKEEIEQMRVNIQEEADWLNGDE
jgi:hypothetical protein